MSKQEDRKAFVAGVTNEVMKEKFIQDLGQKARVERSTITNEHMDELRGVVGDVGRNLEEIGAVPKGMTYCGSLSIHVYKSSLLKTAIFATVNNFGSLDASLAEGALRELTGATMEVFGKQRQKLRSGF